MRRKRPSSLRSKLIKQGRSSTKTNWHNSWVKIQIQIPERWTKSSGSSFRQGNRCSASAISKLVCRLAREVLHKSKEQPTRRQGTSLHWRFTKRRISKTKSPHLLYTEKSMSWPQYTTRTLWGCMRSSIPELTSTWWWSCVTESRCIILSKSVNPTVAFQRLKPRLSSNKSWAQFHLCIRWMSCTVIWNLTTYWSVRVVKSSSLILGFRLGVSQMRDWPASVARHSTCALIWQNEQAKVTMLKHQTSGRLVSSCSYWSPENCPSVLNLRQIWHGEYVLQNTHTQKI